MSIHKKLALLVFSFLMLITISGLSIETYYHFQKLSQQLKQEAHSSVKLLNKDFIKILSFGSPITAAEQTNRLRNLPRIYCVTLFDKNHQAVYRYIKAGSTFKCIPKTDWQNHTVFVKADKGFQLLTSIEYRNSYYGDIVVMFSTDELKAAKQAALKRASIVLLGAIFTSLLLIVLVRRYLTLPVQRLSLALQQVSESHNHSIRLPVRSKDEIGLLYQGFNNMLAEIENNTQQLETINERLDIALSVANDGIWDWYTKSDKLLLDERFYTLSGYEPYEYAGHVDEWTKRVHVDDLDFVQNIIQNCILGKTDTFDIEYRYLCKDNSYMWVRSRGKDVERNQNNHALRLVGSHSDISQRKLTEQALRRSQKMDAIGQLTGGIAHDFNNILGIVLGHLSLLQRQLKNADEKTIDRLDTIQTATKRAVTLTQQLLSFSRQKPSQIKTCDINQSIKDMTSLISQSVTPKIDVQYRFSEDLWLTDIDPGDFSDSVLNLVINARDAMAKEGRLIIETRNHRLDDTFNADIKAGDYVELVISDNGEGIPQEVQDKIFDPFFTTKPQGKGTGLGMSMVFGFIQRSGGDILVYSELEIGTTIRIYLPRSAEQEITLDSDIIQTEEIKAPHATKGTLLIVDDEAELLKLVKESLQSLGYKIVTANNGQMALDILAIRQDITLLFSDIVMPGGINGFKLADTVAKEYPNIRILLASGYADTAHAENGQARFKSALLNKPYSLIDLAKRINEIMK